MKVIPSELVYGQEAVLPVEIGLQSLREPGRIAYRLRSIMNG
jgi:hypothetical protein